jgi:hypothetical protein
LRSSPFVCFALLLGCLAWGGPESRPAAAQEPPYTERPDVRPPHFRVRYEASADPDQLAYPVTYTAWVPPGVTRLRGVIVHQHGCGEGSCRSGLTAAWDLHWQALARRHACALVGPAYEQPEKADCQEWCDPRNGSDETFLRALEDLGRASGHPELPRLPWALWGHSGGGHWAGGMVMLHPERVIAAWLRSGVPLFEADEKRPGIRAHLLPEAALGVPILCNPGTREGVTERDGRFAGVWPANERFFQTVRGRGGLVGVAVDPLTAHECGNQRYLAIPWFDACLSARLQPPPAGSGPDPATGDGETGCDPLRPIPTAESWLSEPAGTLAKPAADWQGEPLSAGWLPDARTAAAWAAYVRDTAVSDASAPPAPKALHLSNGRLGWECEADLESGLAGFVIERDGAVVARLPESPRNPFGRPLFQGLQYSDTPAWPLAEMQFEIAAGRSSYRVRALNTVGLESDWSEAITAGEGSGPRAGR